MAVKLPELDEAIVRAVTDADHPEVTKIEVITEEKPDNHTRVVVHFANGSAAYVMIGEVRNGSRPGKPYEVPEEVLI